MITFSDYTTPHNPPPIGGTEPHEDKENNHLSSPSARKKSTDNTECDATGSSPLRVIQPRSTANLNPSLPSQNVFLTTPKLCSRNPPPFLPPNAVVKPEAQRTPLKQSGTKDKLRPYMPCSSDTEDDSQGSFYPFFQWLFSSKSAVFVPSTHPRSGATAVFKVPAPPSTSGGHRGEASGTSHHRAFYQSMFKTGQ